MLAFVTTDLFENGVLYPCAVLDPWCLIVTLKGT